MWCKMFGLNKRENRTFRLCMIGHLLLGVGLFFSGLLPSCEKEPEKIHVFELASTSPQTIVQPKPKPVLTPPPPTSPTPPKKEVPKPPAPTPQVKPKVESKPPLKPTPKPFQPKPKPKPPTLLQQSQNQFPSNNFERIINYLPPLKIKVSRAIFLRLS